MISFPSATEVNRIIPKEAFYQRLTLSNELKEKFVSDVRHITLKNSLTAQTLHLEQGETISEILALDIELKKQEFDPRIVENIARQNPHKLLFMLRHEDKAMLALYHGKLYATVWKPLGQLALEAKGFTLDAVWDGFWEQIALTNETAPQTELSVEERIKRQEAQQKLQKEIDKTEKLARAEKQPKKRFELYQQVQQLKRRLEELQ